MSTGRPSGKPVVFLGPSLPLEEAKRLCDADFRAPIQRGDLDAFEEGDVVAIIDGVFDSTLAISPREIRKALTRGTKIFGSSSMGALRAAEVPGVIGVGKIFEWYSTGVVEDDDEVALRFDPDSLRPISDPMVNIRHAVEQVRRAATIDDATAQRILRAAKKRFYAERSFKQALRDAGLAARADGELLLQMLQRFDLKRDDAITLLERLGASPPPSRSRGAARRAPRAQPRVEPRFLPTARGLLYLWEYGETVPFGAVTSLAKLTGSFPESCRRAVGRSMLAGNARGLPATRRVSTEDWRRLLIRLRVEWSWLSAEEFQVTLSNLGMSLDQIARRVEEEVQASRSLRTLVRRKGVDLDAALRAELILHELGLKREVIRAGTLLLWARRSIEAGEPAPTPGELTDARTLVCQRLDVLGWERALEWLSSWAMPAREVSTWMETLARARRVGGRVRAAMRGHARLRAPDLLARGRNPLQLRHRLKRPGEKRFATPPAVGGRALPRLKRATGITRVGIVTGLDRAGIPIAHAYRPGGAFSSTIGSGKALRASAAKVGAVMEETEKWCQERFPPPQAREVKGTYEEMARRHRAISPWSLNLPPDTRYSPTAQLAWWPCFDLMAGRSVLVPTAALSHRRFDDDPFYCQRLAKKLFDSNGLASAFTIEEALIHGICEVIERHSTKLAVLTSENPGGPRKLLRSVDSSTLPRTSRELVRRLRRGGARVRIAHVSSDIRVPAFLVRASRERMPVYDFFEADRDVFEGSACHPDPEVALNMALLEAAQVVMTSIAGGREDLTLREHSLGRHERTLAHTPRARWNGFGLEAEWVDFADIPGLVSRDCLAELQWLVETLASSGIEHVLVADLSHPDVRPARVVKVIIPGLEPAFSVCTGDRARAALLDDLLIDVEPG